MGNDGLPASTNGAPARRKPPGERVPLAEAGLELHLQRKALEFRRRLEDQVAQVHGQVDESQARLIALAFVAFQEFLRYSHRLHKAKDLKPESLTAYSDRRVRFLEQCVKAVDRLDLDGENLAKLVYDSLPSPRDPRDLPG